MIRLKRVKADSVFCFDEGAVDLRFPDEGGLYLVEGRNLDYGESNGAGKSSFFNLISLALFGRTPVSPGKDEVINEFLGKDAVVEVTLRNEEGDFDIVYVRGGRNSWFVKKDGRIIFKPKRFLETGKFIRDSVLNGVDFERFCSVVYLVQGGSLGLLEKSKKEVLEVLVRFFSLDVFDRAFDIVRERCKERERRIFEIQKAIESKESLFEERKSLLESLKIEKDIMALRDEVKALERECGAKKKRIMELENKLESIKSLVLEKEQVLKVERDELLKIQVLFSEANRDVLNLEKTLDGIREQIERNKERVSFLEQQIRDELDQFGVSSEKALLELENSIENEIQSFEGKREHLLQRKNNIFGKKEMLKEKLSRIQSFSPGERCDFCGSLLTEEHLSREVERLKKEIGVLEREIEDLGEEILKIEEELTLRKERLQRVREIVEKVKELSVDMRLGIESLERLKRTEEDLKKQISERKLSLETLRSKKEEKERYCFEIEKELENLRVEERSLDSEVKSLIQEMHEVELRKDLLKKELEEIEKIEQKRSEIGSAIEELENEIKRLRSEERVLKKVFIYEDWWRRNLGFLKLFVMDALIEELNESVRRWCEILTDGNLVLEIKTFGLKKGANIENLRIEDLKDKIEFVVNSVGKRDVPVSMYSGGEKQLLSLALVCALWERTDFGFLFLDEVFGSLDLENRRRVAMLLENLRNAGRSIFVVSHLPDIREMVEFDKRIIVERSGGISKVWME